MTSRSNPKPPKQERLFTSDEAATAYQGHHCGECTKNSVCPIKEAMRAPVEPRWIRNFIDGVLNPRECKAKVKIKKARKKASEKNQETLF